MYLLCIIKTVVHFGATRGGRGFAVCNLAVVPFSLYLGKLQMCLSLL